MFIGRSSSYSGAISAVTGPILRRFLAREDGVVAIIATLVIPVLLILTISTIDYANATRLRSAAASSLDAALLAAAREISVGELEENDLEAFVNDYYQANMASKNLYAETIGVVAASYDENTGLVSGRVSGTANSTLANILNPDGVEVAVDAEVTVSLLNVELALVLDVTGSMRGSRLRALQEASEALVNTLIPEDGPVGGLADVRISLVPYSDLVNIGSFEEDITGFTSGKSCVYERQGGLAFNDTAPFGPVAGTGADDDGLANYPPNGNGLRSSKTIVNDPSNFRGYICNNPEVLPLTSNAGDLIAEIDDFSASGWTAGHIGIQWGWYTLSPNFVDVWPGGSTPTNYGDAETIKVMVVMTDGAFNTWYEGGQGNSFGQGERLCDAIRASQIEVYTVGLMTRTSEENFLRGCASSPDHYFDATSGSGLVDAFREIGERLTSIRIAS